MKKSVKFISTVMAGMMLLSSLSVTTVSAAKKKVKVGKPKITAVNQTSGVKITWTKAKNAKKYIVQRKISTAKKFTNIKTVKSGKAGSFVDKKAVAGKNYTYKVTAYNGKVSTASATKKIIRIATPVIADNTKAMGCISISSKGKIKGAKKYEVYRAVVTNGKTGKYTKVATLNNDGMSSYDDFETLNGTFMFKLRAVNGTYKSEYSKAVKIDYMQAPNVMSIVNQQAKSIEVSWNIMPEIDSYKFYRKTENEEAQLVKEIKAEDLTADDFICTYSDTDVTDGVTYEYTVEAYAGNKMSYSTVIITYETAKYYVQVGETSSVIVEEITLLEENLKSMSFDCEVSAVVVSKDTSILEVDSTNYLIGVAPGETEIEVTITTTIDGLTQTYTETSVVKVLPSADVIV